jgi:hypothetical protein
VVTYRPLGGITLARYSSEEPIRSKELCISLRLASVIIAVSCLLTFIDCAPPNNAFFFLQLKGAVIRYLRRLIALTRFALTADTQGTLTYDQTETSENQNVKKNNRTSNRNGKRI